jgi:flagellar motor switch protein FliG
MEGEEADLLTLTMFKSMQGAVVLQVVEEEEALDIVNRMLKLE